MDIYSGLADGRMITAKVDVTQPKWRTSLDKPREGTV